MELNFSELDNSYTQNPYQNFNNSTQLNNPDKYWENYQEPNKTQQVKKKKVSFDDILTNMNLVVNKSGVLQFMQPLQNDEYYPDQQNQYPQYQQQNQYPQYQQQKQYPQYQQQKQQPYQEYVAQQIAKRPQIQNKNQNQNQNIKKINQNQPPIDPALKNSFLYNKYFKDYKEATTNEPQVRVPKTMQEYRNMLIEDKIKQIQQKKRIADIKSTKLLFTTNNNTNNQNDIRVSKNNNHLRSMSFH
jgi:hypothetical protein